jgi:hypothetical protein
VPFDKVTHTAHVETAISIIQSGEIRPSLVFDESRLNKQRILVSWLSPNTWGTGSRYGNIDFAFDFDDLIDGKRYYWVEPIAYKIAACRILVTDINHDKQLERYYPIRGDGPWWFDKSTKTHYFNNNHCLEFMVEAPLRLSELRSLDFTRHNNQYCALHRNNPRRCPEFGLSDTRGAEKFLARAATVDLSISKFIKNNDRAKFIAKGAVSDLVYFNSKKSKGTITADSPLATAQSRAFMSAFAFGHEDEAELLAGQFKSRDEFAKAVAEIMTDVTGISEWTDRD